MVMGLFFFGTIGSMDKCLHVAKDPAAHYGKITPQSTRKSYILCKECLAIYQTNPRANPVDSVAYNLYYSLDQDLPRNQWIKANDEPIPPTPTGKVGYRIPAGKLIKGADYYCQVVTVNALGFESSGKTILVKYGDDLPTF